MKTKTFIDPMTKKPIEYNENSVFGIFTKIKSGRKYPRRFFNADQISEAFKSFYDLDIPSSHRKHLMIFESKENLDTKDGILLLSMEGYLPNIKEFALNTQTPRNECKKVATLNLINTPEAIAKKLRALDFSNFPVVSEKWTQTKVIYCLLAYLFSLPKDKQHDLMREAFYFYLQEKLDSSGRIQDIKYVTEVKPKLDPLDLTNVDELL